MSLLRAASAAALTLLLLCCMSGCAFLSAPARKAGAEPPAGSRPAEIFTLGSPQEFEQQSNTLGVQIIIDAPGALKSLLEKYLDLSRLGRIARDDVDDTEWSRLIDAAPAQVKELLQTEGYFAPTIRLERAPRRAAGEADVVRLRVEPGVRARVSRVTIEAEGELERGATAGDAYASNALAQLRSSWELASGRDFRNASWVDAKAAALARLRAAGYAAANWSGTGAEVDLKQNEVRLFLVADSGPLFRYGELEIEGLVAQNSSTVANLLAAARGTPVSETVLLDFQDRLQKSGLFENVNVTLDTDTEQAAAARIFARVREAPLQTYTFGLGISANNGPRASVEHFYRRVLGFAASSRLKIELGQRRQAWDGEISTHPLEGQRRFLLGGAVERLLSDTDTVLSQRLRVGRTQDKSNLERLHFLEWERSLRVAATGQRRNALALSANFHGAWRDLDNAVLPTRGLSLAVQVGSGYSTGTDADKGVFGRAYGRLTGYLPLGQAWYGQARIELGQVFLRGSMVVPESQKWRAGGDDSVRGYAYRSLGPLTDAAVGSGNALFTVSAEVARPFLARLPALWGALFVDAGNAADKLGAVRPVLGLGAGLRWRSPVGPLRLDLAWAEQTQKFRLHFSVGIAF